MCNQSLYNVAIAGYANWQVDSSSNRTMTAHACGKKQVDPEGVFHMVYTGGKQDTVVYYLRCLPGDTNLAPSETLGVGKFPTIVVRQGGNWDTLGVAYLSKVGDSIFYKYRLDSLWRGPYLLANSSIDDGLSVPRMALGPGDTIHISFAAKSTSFKKDLVKPIKNIAPDRMTIGDIILFYGKFHLSNPTLTVQQVSSWTPATQGPIDSLGAAIAIDYSGVPYLAWVENTSVMFGYKSGGSFVTKILSTSSSKSNACMVSPGPAEVYNVGVGWGEGSSIVHSYFYIGDTAEMFRDTVYTGQEPRNVTGKGSFIVFEDDGDVFTSLWDAANRAWSEPETLNTDSLPAAYPCIEADQFISGDSICPARFALWTQQIDDTLYTLGGDIKKYTNTGEYGITPYAYLKMGQRNPTPFTAYRDGIKLFGDEEYMQADYGTDSLVYRFPYIEPSGNYRLFTEFYFDTTTSPEGWRMGIRINGLILRDSIPLYSKELLRVTELLPTQPLNGCSLRIKLINQYGDYVPSPRIILTKFEEEGLQAMGGPQLAKLERLPGIFALFQNYPNPFRLTTTIKYQLPVETFVSLKVYDVSGRIVRRLVNATQKPGYYTITWDGKADNGLKVATGVYFYRLETKDYKSTKKVVRLK